MITTSPLARRIAALALAGTLLLPAGTALAAPSTHFSDHRIDVAADFQDDQVIASLRIQQSLASGSSADITIWTPPDRFYAGEPPTIVSGDADLTASPDDATLTGSVELFVLATGEFVGEATVDAALTPDGPAQTGESAAVGNHKLRLSQTTQPMTVSGLITLPDGMGVIDLAVHASGATVTDVEASWNAPSSTVSSLDFIGMFATWEVDGNLVMVIGNHDATATYVDAAIIMADGTILNGVQDGAVFGARRIEADVPLAAVGSGLAASGGTLTVRADVSRGDRTRDIVENGDTRTQVTVQELMATGTVEVSLDDGTFMSFDMADAGGSFYDWSERSIDGGRAG
jgi:hypothetical protein